MKQGQPPKAGSASTTKGSVAGAGRVDGQPRPVAGAGLPALPRQRRRRMFVLAVLLVAAGAVLAGYVFQGMNQRVPVVMVTRDVPVGAQISAADVGVTTVAVDGVVARIPGRQLREVVGRIAGVDLRAGTLLSASQLSGAVAPGPGQQVVPVAVKLAQLPARGLRPGDQVLVVATPGSPTQAGPEEGSPPLDADTQATVDAVSAPDVDGMVRVDLVVPAEVGPAVLRQASTGRIGFVLTSRRQPQ